jgi:C-terminal processing protease CtpA/Prc
MRLPVDFGGQWIELRGFLRTERVSEFAGLWMRQEGPDGVVQFDNMQRQGLTGTTDWTAYTVRLPLDPGARDLVFGVLVGGEGALWADDLQILVDGRPLSQVPRRPRVATILDTDTAFAASSGVTVTSLTPAQVERVVLLGRVWGFLKYHHPRIAAGGLHWDFELFRVLPRVLAAPDRESAQRTLSQWVAALGVPEDCGPCAVAPGDAHLRASLAWIQDDGMLGPALARQLQAIHTRRFAGAQQFYVSHAAGVGNPVFDREPAYSRHRPPDAGYRILALLRFWSIIEYWFPYRDQLDDDWPSVLRDALPRFVAASSWDAYRLELLALIARVGDTHANLWSELDVRPPRGDCMLPVGLRFVENRLTVTALVDTVAARSAGIAVGDVLEAIDGLRIDSLVAAWSPYYAASNEPTRLRDIARFLPRGPCGESRLAVERQGAPLIVTMPRATPPGRGQTMHDRPGETFQLLSADVAYLKLSSVRVQDVPRYIERAGGTRGLVIDIRNYPSEFVVFALGARLVDQPTPFARFTVGSTSNPGAFTWTEPLILEPQSPGYRGKVAILVDEVSVSQAEYTAMALRAGPRAIVVGSTTAGADGNVSAIPLPGGLRTMISGIGVFYPDKTPTQRIGIVPDVVVRPTIAGVRQGRDEVLEEALRRILGPDADEATVRRLARRS